jgi:hypothetical protein
VQEGTSSPNTKPIQVRPEEKNVATRKGRARGGNLSVFAHLVLITMIKEAEQWYK